MMWKGVIKSCLGLLLIIFIFFGGNEVNGENCTVERNFGRVITPGKYVTTWKLEKSCRTLRAIGFEWDAYFGEIPPPEPSCDKFVNGLEEFTIGTIPSRFDTQTDSDDGNCFERCHQRLFQFNCDEDGDYKHVNKFQKHLPGSPLAYFEYYIGDGDSGYTSGLEWITPESLKQTIINDVNLELPESSYVKYLAESFFYERGLTVLNVNVARKIFTAKINVRKVEPSPELKLDYHWLPKDIRGSEFDYHIFIKKYGTHMRTEAVFGGFWTAMLWPMPARVMNSINSVKSTRVNDELLARNILLQIPSFGNIKIPVLKDTSSWKGPIKEYYTVNVTTLARGINNVNDIICDDYRCALDDNNIMKKPFPLSSKFIKLNDFLDKPSSKKHQSMGQAIQNEEEHNRLKRVLFQLEEISDSSIVLANKMKSTIRQELPFLCKSAGLQNLITYGILQEKNFDLKKFTLEIKTSQKPNQVYEIPLIHGICFNFNNKTRLEGAIEHVQMSFPRDVDCYSIYMKKSCKGPFVKVYGEEEMKKYVGKAVSISLCPYCIKPLVFNN